MPATTLRLRVLLFDLCLVACGSRGRSFAGSDGGNPSICPSSDCDGDGYSAPADCNDADPEINPEAYDFVLDGIDNDCDGVVDDPVDTCETPPAQTPPSPADFARASDLCAQRAIAKDGKIFDPLVDARWGSVTGYGGVTRWISATKPEQVAIVSGFGDNAPRRGKTMSGLSNGPWGTHTPRESPALDPQGFHLDSACADVPLAGADCASLTNGAPSGGVSVQDWAELALSVRVPSNAHAMALDFSFFSSEFSQFWDSAFNDAFFVLVTSGESHGSNVASGSNGMAVTIDNAFFQLCPAPPGPPNLSSDKSAALAHCVGNGGDASQQVFGSLRGTFFDGAGSPPYDGTATSNDGTHVYVYGGGTGWLTSEFAVTPREKIVMRIVVLDTFDGLKDSAVLLDALRWERTLGGGGGTRRPTPVK